MPTLNKPDGTIATSSKDKAEALHIFFNSVNIPDVPSHDNGETLSNVNITPNIVENKLEKLDPNK